MKNTEDLIFGMRQEDIPVYDNLTFRLLLEAVVSLIEEKHPVMDGVICQLDDSLITFVHGALGKKVFDGPVFSLSTVSGSHLNIKSYKENLDITRVISKKKGDGSKLMEVIMVAYKMIKKYADEKNITLGDLTLECVGVVGMYHNYNECPIQEQTKFFRKFGFRKQGKYHPEHIRMKYVC